MSLPKKKSRVTHVDGKQFRYLFRVYGGEECNVSLFIQEDCKNPGNVLMLDTSDVILKFKEEQPKFTDADFLEHLGKYGLGPGDVSKIIVKAKAAGWEPSKKGGPFRLNKVEVKR